jgi:hypothetical protein
VTVLAYLWSINLDILKLKNQAKMKKNLMLMLSIVIFSSCNSFKGYIKKSANEEVFDRKGFQGKKRMPIYNRKYIDRAKANIEEGYLEDKEEVDNFYYEPNELKPYYQSNRRMYQDMVEMNENKQNLSYKRKNSYPRLSDIEKSYKDDANQESLKSEIRSIKKMLEETKEKLATYKCPAPQDNSLKNNKLPKPAAPKQDQDFISTIIDSAKPQISKKGKE